MRIKTYVFRQFFLSQLPVVRPEHVKEKVESKLETLTSHVKSKVKLASLLRIRGEIKHIFETMDKIQGEKNEWATPGVQTPRRGMSSRSSALRSRLRGVITEYLYHLSLFIGIFTRKKGIKLVPEMCHLFYCIVFISLHY